MEKLLISATKRSERGRAVNRLRREGVLPAVVYGHHQEATALSLDAKSFAKTYAQAGESTLITLQIEGLGEVVTIVKDVTYHPVQDVPTHVDFLQINLKEELETSIAIEFIGESSGVKNQNAVLVTNMNELQVRCLPSALVHNFTVDISSLVEYGDAITVGDIKVPAGIEILDDNDHIVVTITAPKAEEAPVEGAEEATAEVEVLKQKSPEEIAADEAAKKKEEKKNEKK